MQKIDEYLCNFDNPMIFDESTMRKKLKEYDAEGIIVSETCGRKKRYRRAEDSKVPWDFDTLHFYSEIAPCGVVGSYLLEKCNEQEDHFGFKHHYKTSTLDSGVLCKLFEAMRLKSNIQSGIYPAAALSCKT